MTRAKSRRFLRRRDSEKPGLIGVGVALFLFLFWLVGSAVVGVIWAW